jgi:hypothetical protein
LCKLTPLNSHIRTNYLNLTFSFQVPHQEQTIAAKAVLGAIQLALGMCYRNPTNNCNCNPSLSALCSRKRITYNVDLFQDLISSSLSVQLLWGICLIMQSSKFVTLLSFLSSVLCDIQKKMKNESRFVQPIHSEICLIQKKLVHSTLFIIIRLGNTQADNKYIVMLQQLITSGYFYYSHTYDLTNSLQRIATNQNNVFETIKLLLISFPLLCFESFLELEITHLNTLIHLNCLYLIQFIHFIHHFHSFFRI